MSYKLGDATNFLQKGVFKRSLFKFPNPHRNPNPFILRWMSDTTVQLQQDSLQQKQDLSGSLVAELGPDVVITNTPGRRKWTALETADLIDGCVKVRFIQLFLYTQRKL
jgi:hypothetical protein